MPANFAPTSLDHVALWVDEREPLATFLCDHLGMHVIEETDTFTLLGVDAKLGKLTLFDAEGPRRPGGLPLGLVEADGRDFDLDHVVLGLEDPEAAATALEEMGFERRSEGQVAVADRYVRIVHGNAADGDRPLLNHLAL